MSRTSEAADALQKFEVLSQLGGVVPLVAVLRVQLALSHTDFQLSRLQPEQVPQVLRDTHPFLIRFRRNRVYPYVRLL